MVIESIEKFKEILVAQKKFIIVIRHAEKYLKKDPNQDVSALITEKGIQDSLIFGKILKDLFPNISLMKSSPIKRCIQTAKYLLQAFSEFPIISTSKSLGDPGIFVSNDKIAMDNFIEFGVKGVVERQLAGIVLPGLRDFKSGLKMFLNEAIKDLNNLEGFGIYITHDAIVIPIIKYFTDEFEYSENLINYLDGFIIWKENEEHYLIWNEEKYLLNEKINQLINDN